MALSLKTLFYQIFIDPILSRLHQSVLNHLEVSDRVLDVACGTGALAMAMATKAGHVTGIDLSAEVILAAKRSLRRKGIKNVDFEIRDAVTLSCYRDKEFDIAVTSMAIHQFEAGLATQVLSEMRRIARRLILVDYNHHMPRGWGRSLAWTIERLAGGDHYRNFRTYMQKGGLYHFTRQTGISLSSLELRGGGVFVVAVAV